MRNQHTFVKTVPVGFCTKCRVQKTADDFYKSQPTQCKPCFLAITRAWKKAHTKETQAHKRQCLYGISENDYSKMLGEQDGKCALCLRQTNLQVDHDHKTGKVRGLLCALCNKALGLFKDNPDILQRGYSYVQR